MKEKYGIVFFSSPCHLNALIVLLIPFIHICISCIWAHIHGDWLSSHDWDRTENAIPLSQFCSLGLTDIDGSEIRILNPGCPMLEWMLRQLRTVSTVQSNHSKNWHQLEKPLVVFTNLCLLQQYQQACFPQLCGFCSLTLITQVNQQQCEAVSHLCSPGKWEPEANQSLLPFPLYFCCASERRNSWPAFQLSVFFCLNVITQVNKQRHEAFSQSPVQVASCGSSNGLMMKHVSSLTLTMWMQRESHQ